MVIVLPESLVNYALGYASGVQPRPRLKPA